MYTNNSITKNANSYNYMSKDWSINPEEFKVMIDKQFRTPNFKLDTSDKAIAQIMINEGRTLCRDGSIPSESVQVEIDKILIDVV